LHLNHQFLSLCTNNLSVLPDVGYYGCTENKFAIFPESNIHAYSRRKNSVLCYTEITTIQTGPGATQSPIDWLLGAVLPGVKHARGDEKRTENITGNTRRKEPTSQTYNPRLLLKVKLPLRLINRAHAIKKYEGVQI
jgi:hypothetical protein